MATRTGRKGSFRYFDARGREIRDLKKIERFERLAIPPAWKDVWIASHSGAKLQATCTTPTSVRRRSGRSSRS
jgi:DNA topoisomerase-1